MYGLMENAIYGGRVDNTFDTRVLRSYLHQCFSDFTVSGQAGTPVRGGTGANARQLKLPFGNIPVSTRMQVGSPDPRTVARVYNSARREIV